MNKEETYCLMDARAMEDPDKATCMSACSTEKEARKEAKMFGWECVLMKIVDKKLVYIDYIPA